MGFLANLFGGSQTPPAAAPQQKPVSGAQAKATSDAESAERARVRSLISGEVAEVFTGGGSLATEEPRKRTLLT